MTMPANWRTTAAGLLPFFIGAVHFIGQLADIVAQSSSAPPQWHMIAFDVALMATAVGHFYAKDAKQPDSAAKPVVLVQSKIDAAAIEKVLKDAVEQQGPRPAA